MDRTNISDSSLKQLSPNPDIITLDLSNTSLKKGVLICKDILKPGGMIVALIKPVYEIESSETRKNVNINQHDILRNIITDLCGYFLNNAFDITGLTHSSVKGNNDALEYFVCLNYGGEPVENINDTYRNDIEKIIEKSFSLGKFKKNDHM